MGALPRPGRRHPRGRRQHEWRGGRHGRPSDQLAGIRRWFPAGSPLDVAPPHSQSSCSHSRRARWCPSRAGAQEYFGGNKVQYRTFTFEVLHTDHFDIYFYPEEREAAAIAARMAERWRARLERTLNHELSGRQPLILYASHTHFEQTNAIGGEIGEGTGGVTESVRRRIILPLGGPLADTDHVIGHELVHAFQFDITAPVAKRRPAGSLAHSGCRSGSSRAWRSTSRSVRSIRTRRCGCATRSCRKKLPRIKDLDNPEYFPYRWGQAFWAYVAGRWGDEMVGRLLRDASRAGSPEMAIEVDLGMKTDQLSDEWHAALAAARAADAAQYVTGRIRRGPGHQAARPGRRIERVARTQPRRAQGRLPLERSLFSIDLYIAERGHRRDSRPCEPHRRRSALQQPAVHLLGGRLGHGQGIVSRSR